MKANEAALKKYREGNTIAGFELVRMENLSRMAMTALEFKHRQSGARLLHLAADDSENLFGVAFRTPPPDDTGLPHILEHTVLCGSRRYPVKDPFVELLKTSLATFLNAFTYPDRTIYPCSSMNAKDFHNLMRVYCDAALFPLITEDHFRQEGHHLVFGPDGKPAVKGVVYNEMRGVYSDPDSIMSRHLQRELFASNAYGRDFGGDPRFIPDLTYEQFTAFHKAYYHPSNAWMFTYGDVDIASTLTIINNEYLVSFNDTPVDSTIAPLAPWSKPATGVFAYPVGANDPLSGKTDIAVAFATNDSRDNVTTLAMKVVDMYLLDNAASPLRKALIDSKLGEELGSSGYADYQRDTMFQTVLNGSEADRADKVEALCLDVTASECDRGFDKEKVESALRRLELSAREIRPQYPLRLMERAFSVWLYDSDPLPQIQIADRLDELRVALAEDGKFLEGLTRKWLVDNPHRLRVTLTPDPGFIERLDQETSADIERRVASLSPEEKARAERDAARLEEMQSEGNTPEALATLPRLARSDVSPKPIPLEYRVEKVSGNDTLETPIYAGGVSYLSMSMVLDNTHDMELDYLPLFCEALTKTGAAGLDYARMAEREAAATGGLDFSVGLVPHVDGPEKARLRVSLWLKALDSDWEKALAVAADRLFEADFTDRDRMRDIVLQSRVAWRNQIVPSGNAYASLYASRCLNPAMALSERLAGCTQARFVDRLAADMDKTLDTLPAIFDSLRRQLLERSRPAASQVGGDAAVRAGKAWLAQVYPRFKGSEHSGSLDAVACTPGRVGLAAPADVAFAAQSLVCPPLSAPAAPALTLLCQQLSYGFMWNEIRVKGGAYGARASFDGARGVVGLSSFRDPNIARTLEVFSRIGRHIVEEMDLTPDGLEQSVIGAVKVLDQPVRPSSAVSLALTRHLGGETPEFRQAFRTRLLSLSEKDIRDAAAVFAPTQAAPVCVLSSLEKLTEQNRDHNADLAIEPLWENAEKERDDD